MSLSVPTPLAVLAWALAGPFLLVATGLGTSSLQEDQEYVRPVLAAVAAGFVLVAAQLIVIAVTSLSPGKEAEPLSGAARSALGIVASVGLLVAAYVFYAAAPGDPAFSDSWSEGVVATAGLWLGLTGIALLDRRLCWLAAAVACLALLLASVAVMT
jgi:hypothetical protein